MLRSSALTGSEASGVRAEQELTGESAEVLGPERGVEAGEGVGVVRGEDRGGLVRQQPQGPWRCGT